MGTAKIDYSLPQSGRRGTNVKSLPGGSSLYKCSANPRHKNTFNTAKNNKWFCTHCGAPLRARKDKIEELHRLAKQLGYKVTK